MAKRREVDAHFDQRGYAKSGDAYNKAMLQCSKKQIMSHSYYGSATPPHYRSMKLPHSLDNYDELLRSMPRLLWTEMKITQKMVILAA